MSCIAGIINRRGEPADRKVLSRMLDAMQVRAPDGASIWTLDAVGLGHSRLTIGRIPNGGQKPHPATLDGLVWITADARIDARDELIPKLRSRGEDVHPEAADGELILHAYRAFGNDFLDHLLGDFAFALWDAPNRNLICARDPLGIRPFFYSMTNKCLLFASDPDALLVHEETSQDLDHGFIADFLVFGVCIEPELSVYRHIKRLPSASTLRYERDELRINRYWTLPLDPDPPPRASSAGAYREEFAERFSRAVKDRVRAPVVGIELSGGLDSGSIAAELAILRRSQPLSVQAYSNASPTLAPGDDERDFATETAAHLQVPVHFQNWEETLFGHCQEAALITAEPCLSPDLFSFLQQARHMQELGARVLLTGQMGDALFSGSRTWYRTLVDSGHFFRVMTEMVRSAKTRRSVRGLGLKTLLFGSTAQKAIGEATPSWLHPDFIRSVDVPSRWEKCQEAWNRAVDRRTQFEAPWLAPMLEGYGALKWPMEVRHPFCDLRLVEFMRHVPNYAVLNKAILREAMRGKLPERVRIRPKTPLAGDPYGARLFSPEFISTLPAALEGVDGRFIDFARYLEHFNRCHYGNELKSPWPREQLLAPLAMGCWLQQKSQTSKGVPNECTNAFSARCE